MWRDTVRAHLPLAGRLTARTDSRGIPFAPEMSPTGTPAPLTNRDLHGDHSPLSGKRRQPTLGVGIPLSPETSVALSYSMARRYRQGAFYPLVRVENCLASERCYLVQA